MLKKYLKTAIQYLGSFFFIISWHLSISRGKHFHEYLKFKKKILNGFFNYVTVKFETKYILKSETSLLDLKKNLYK